MTRLISWLYSTQVKNPSILIIYKDIQVMGACIHSLLPSFPLSPYLYLHPSQIIKRLFCDMYNLYKMNLAYAVYNNTKWKPHMSYNRGMLWWYLFPKNIMQLGKLMFLLFYVLFELV